MLFDCNTFSLNVCFYLTSCLFSPSVLLGEEDERGTLKLTFDLPQSSLLKLNPVLLLGFESPLTGGNLDVTFTGQSLHPNTQVKKGLV